MSEEFKDRKLKYIDLPKQFERKANEIRVTSKQHLRSCEKLADHLAKLKPKNPKEFEQNEWLKDFVIKSADLNEKTIELLEYLKTELQEVAKDASALMDGAKIHDQLRDQSDVILMAWDIRDKAIKDLYEIRKLSFRENTATA